MGICVSSSQDQNIVPLLYQETKANSFFPHGNQTPQNKTNPSLTFQFKETPTHSNANDLPPPKFKRRDMSQMTVLPSKQQPYKRGFKNPQANSTKYVRAKVSNIEAASPSDNTSKNDDPEITRRNKKSTTLVERSKTSAIFAEELKLCVLKQTIIGDSGNNPLTKYQVIRKLGEGSYGVVYLVLNNVNNTRVTMKKIIKVKENEVDNLAIKNEIDILRKLDHPNIVKIIEYYETAEAYYIITEFCEKGELYGYINHEYSERQLAVLFYQVFSGLCYLHDNNILHRDIKLENVLVSEIEKDPITSKLFYWIKIIDFGTAKIFLKNKRERAIVGSSYYIAPEVLKKNYNEKCDTWSVGVILYMLIVGRAPFDGEDDDEIISRIKIGTYNTKHKKLLDKSPELQDLVKKLLDVNNATRLSAKQALDHSWFKKVNGRWLYSNFEESSILPYINNLFGYTFQSKFQQLVLAFIVHNIPISNETKIIHKLFRYFNLKGDCKLSKPELTEGLCQFKPREEVNRYIEDIFILLDGDNNGYIEYEEFLRACLDKRVILCESNLKYAFDFLDKEKTHNLSAKVIMSSFVQEGNTKLEEIFQHTIDEVDTDHDGHINFEEFKELMLEVS